MKKRKTGERLVSLLVSLAMLLSLFGTSGIWGTAYADMVSADANAKSESSQKPTLFIDFLGDSVDAFDGTRTGITHTSLTTAAPTTTDRSKTQSGDKSPAGTWERYSSSSYESRVFWVGVGINKMQYFELSKDGKGLTGLELGFYYNPEFVEPYTDSGKTYAQTLAAANLGSNPLNQWDSGLYHIEDAQYGLDLLIDPETQEPMSLRNPDDNSYIEEFDLTTSPGNTWKRLHVSLERNINADGTFDPAGSNRFATTPAGYDDGNIYYVMMLPFKLVKYDGNKQVCFRLTRNAALFSMGGGTYGAASYSSGFPVDLNGNGIFESSAENGLYENADDATFGAWERETRTVGHNLKEMFTFEGDLNIFTGMNESDNFFTATLQVSPADENNYGILYPSDDPATRITVKDNDGGIINNLTGGTSMTLEVVKSSKNVVVYITSGSGEDVKIIPYIEADGKYTFVMPEANVSVSVRLYATTEKAEEYQAQLALEGTAGKAKNAASISGENKAGASGDGNKTDVSGGYIMVKPNTPVTVQVDRHPDYKATVKAETLGGTKIDVTDVEVDEAGAGTYTLEMQPTDIRVTVTYTLLSDHEAWLGVEADANISPSNIARLSTTVYNVSDDAVPVYRELNGQVGGYEKIEKIPQYRNLSLDIAVAEGYMVTAVELYRMKDNNFVPVADITEYLVNQTSVIDGTTFHQHLDWPMPDETIEFVVRFARAENFDVKLIIKGAEAGDTATVEGRKGYLDSMVTDSLGMNSTSTSGDKIQVMTGNLVTLTTESTNVLRHVKSVKVTTDDPLHPTLTYSGTLNEDDLTFHMVGANVTVTVEFEEIPRESYSATMDISASSSTATLGPGTGWPADASVAASPVTYPTITGQHAGDLLTGWVQVAAGWHISSVKAVGETTGNTYPLLSISGNGYNNGTGGKVVFTLDQPAENVRVTVELKEGPPDPEPDQGLTLMVAHVGEDTSEGNWAKMDIKHDGSWKGALPAGTGVTMSYNDGNGYTDTVIAAGDPVKVNFGADTDYYVSKVEVTPSAYGVVPTWTGAGTVEFEQPTGPATVTVYFAKKDPATAPKVYLHAVDYAVGEDARLTLDATTIIVPPGSPDFLTAYPGDTLTTNAVIATHPDRKVKVEVFRGGSAVPWTSTGAEGEGKGTFVMPSGGDVHVYVTFYDKDAYPKGNLLTLSAWDVDTTSAKGTAGRAELHVAGDKFPSDSGNTAQSNDTTLLPAPVKGYVEGGKTVKVIARPEDGYVVDHITYTPAGSVSPVELAAPSAGGRTVEFTMPDSATGVEVWFRKGEAEKHMANITLWPPAGSTAAEAGDAQFVDKTTGDLLGYSVSEPAGTGLRVKAKANDGYYIKEITITPASLGIASPITGVFATQTVDFVMPDADCTVNIYYEKGWPDGLQAILNVDGPTGVAGNTAQLYLSEDNHTSAVPAVGSATLSGVTPGDIVQVKMTVADGHYVDLPIQIRDSEGASVSYWWSGEHEVSFQMPGTWVKVDVKFTTDAPAKSYWVKVFDDAVTTTLSGGGSTVTGVNAQLTGLQPGNTVTVTVPEDGTGNLPVVTVLRESDNGVIATVGPTSVGGNQHEYTFSMQEDNAKITIYYVSPPGVGEHLTNLIVTQETGTGGAGKAELYWMDGVTKKTTNDVSSVGSQALPVKDGETVTLTVTPGTGYVLKSVVIKTADGTAVPVTLTGVAAGVYTYEYTSPEKNVTATVTFREKTDEDAHLRAQVVVNNAGNTGNTALLYRGDGVETVDDGADLLTPLSPADKVMLALTVAPGFEVDLVMANTTTGDTVTISPLLKLHNQDQEVHFFMPADDVIVYVRFKTDGKTRYNITLSVDNPSLDANTASISTDFSGEKGPVKYVAPPAANLAVVQGAPGEMVTVTTTPQTGYYPVVTAVSDDSSKIPVTNLTVSPDGTTFTFSVPGNHVKVSVLFKPEPVTEEHRVTLHVVNGDMGTVKVVDRADASYQIDNDTEFMVRPYLNWLNVDVKADNGKYIQAAYATVGEVTLPMVLPGSAGAALGAVEHTSGGALIDRSFDFLMQNEDVDVYVVFTENSAVKPYTIALTVTGPDGVGAAGSATMVNDKGPAGNQTGTVESNQTFNITSDIITYTGGDTFTVRIKPNAAYQIDTVVVTPLSYGVVPQTIEEVDGEWVYTFQTGDDLKANLAVNVTLKTKDVETHTVTLHLVDPAGNEVNSTQVKYTAYTLTTNGATMPVPEGQKVTILVNPGQEALTRYYVRYAYAVALGGAVLPLSEFDPDTLISLQNVGKVSSTEHGEAKFTMPDRDVDVYVEYRSVDDPDVGAHSAVLTVTEPNNLGQSRVTMTNTALSESVEAPGDGKPHETDKPINTNAGDVIYLSWAGKLIDSHRVKSITITGGKTDAVYTLGDDALPVGATQFSFPAPDYDIGVIVELEQVDDPPTYTATLRIVDHSSALGNTVLMLSGSKSTNVDGGKLTGLGSVDYVYTTPTVFDSKVKVQTVLATDASGTHVLETDTATYSYQLDHSDVEITVIFDNAADSPKMYVASVEKTGASTLVKNTATVSNTTTPALPSGLIWTGVYGGDQLRVDVTTETGYYAVITAKTAGDGGVDLPVLQVGVASTAESPVVTGYIAMPAGLDRDVLITVNYTTDKPIEKHALHLALAGSETGAGNSATVRDEATLGGAVILAVSDAAGSENASYLVEGDAALVLDKVVADGWYVKEITLQVDGGAKIVLPVLDTGVSFDMPLVNTTVTVSVVKGQRTARPHDWKQHPASETAFVGYQDGFLKGENLGGNRVRIPVFNLYDGAASPKTIAAYDKTDHVYEYKLYIREGGNYIPLARGVDYELVSSGSFVPDAANTGAPPDFATYDHTDTGWELVIRSLKGESALTELIRGGTTTSSVICITATEVTEGQKKDESEYVEVVLDKDDNAGKYTATLQIVDNSGAPAGSNEAQLSDGKTTIKTSGASITGLQGDELIRTLVTKIGDGVRVSAVTVTDSAGTRLLEKVPAGVDRYPYYMTGENIVVTVYFETDETDDLTRHIASVSKTGGISVSGNEASIKNDTRDDLAKGTIWAEGHEGNFMKVTVQLAEGCYAEVTAYRKDLGPGAGDLPVTAFGMGPGVDTFDAFFEMPDSDVQVIVDYTRVSPLNLLKKLTLELVDGVDFSELDVNNEAWLENTTGSSHIALHVDTANYEISEDTVAAGTKFSLRVKPDTAKDYYVKEVLAYIPATSETPAQTLPLTPSASGEYVGSFAMPTKAARVQVVFSNVPRTPRPYDPNHATDYNLAYPDPETNPDLSSPAQQGWIRAEAADPADPTDPTETDPDKLRNRIQVTIPTLHDDEGTEPALSNAYQDVSKYHFYWKTGYGDYYELVVGTDIAITEADPKTTSNSYTYYSDPTDPSTGTPAGPRTGYRIYLTALTPGGLMDYYITSGGTIYVTAEDSPRAESSYTQIVIPRAYRAILHYGDGSKGRAILYQGTEKPAGSAAIVTTNDGELTGLKGTETVTVDEIALETGFTLVGVVAETTGGAVNAQRETDEKYTYGMDHADVTLRLVYGEDADVLKEKGPRIVTVYKRGDDGLSGNSASVTDLDVDIPETQRGSIWTAAYEGNVVRVNFGTEGGYYATVTAEEKNRTSGTAGDVRVVQYGSYALFYMPDHADVDVTVTYSTTKPDDGKLGLVLKDYDDKPDNKATVNTTLLTANGTNNSTAAPEPVAVAVDTTLTLETDVDADYFVAGAVLKTNEQEIDVPLVDGKSLPDAVMPRNDAALTVTYQNGSQTPRPYDPKHSTLYNGVPGGGNYPTSENPDRSATHMAGWLLAETDGTSDSIKIPVPTLYDYRKLPVDALSDAYSGVAYRLYWKDEMGNFQEFDTDADITVTGPTGLAGSAKYESFSGAELTVTLKSGTSLWGGYKFAQYLKEGGSIYITATGTAAPESGMTEVVIFVTPKTYSATFYYEPNGSAGTMTIPGKTAIATTGPEGRSGWERTDLEGNELITLSGITPVTGYTLSGVVATTEAGSVNVTGTAGTYTYTMTNADVVLQAVYKKTDDPLDGEKALHIVTVYQTGELAGARSIPTVADLDLDIPVSQRGEIWTVAYADNVVRVDAAVRDGYYAKITAKKHGGADLDVAQFATFTTDATPVFAGCYGLFYMPDDADVDVQVEYIKVDALPEHRLKLEVVQDTWGVAANEAKINTTSLLVANATDSTTAAPAAVDVAAGTALELETGTDPGWSVQSATLETGGVTVDIPLTSGTSLPVPAMPFGDTVITVAFVKQAQTGRPYDPNHSDEYKTAFVGKDTKYKDTPVGDDEGNLDLSTTGQDGWLLAGVTEGGTGFSLTVPTLYDYRGSSTADKLSDAAAPASAYTFYWKDSAGKLVPFTVGEGKDITVENGSTSTDSLSGKTAYTLTVKINQSGDPSMPTLWGGYKLQEYLDDGGSIYVSATVDGKAESEKTEVVIKGEDSALRPYDPANLNAKNNDYEDNWITSENRGDYLIVTVPRLDSKGGTKPTAVDGNQHRFQIHLQVNGSDRDSAVVNVTDLLELVNVLDYDFGLPDSKYGGPGMVNEYYSVGHDTLTYAYKDFYENGKYPETATETGARFIVALKEEPDPADYAGGSSDPEYIADHGNWKVLEAIIRNNEGTMGADHHYRLYITVDVAANPATVPVPEFSKKDYVDLEVPRYYSLRGTVESYAPTHITTFRLYPLKTGGTASDPGDYETDAAFTLTNYQSRGTGLWQEGFALRSSALAGKTPATGVTYLLTVEKAAHVTYTLTELVLKTDTLDDGDDLSFTFKEWDDTGTDKVDRVIALFGGDADGSQHVTESDYFTLLAHINRISSVFDWTRTKDPADGDWALSVYNSASSAYYADANGDGRLGMADAVCDLERNAGKSAQDYEAAYLEQTLPTYVAPTASPLAATGMMLMMGSPMAAPEKQTAESLLAGLADGTVTVDDLLAETDGELLQAILDGLDGEKPQLNEEEAAQVAARIQELQEEAEKAAESAQEAGETGPEKKDTTQAGEAAGGAAEGLDETEKAPEGQIDEEGSGDDPQASKTTQNGSPATDGQGDISTDQPGEGTNTEETGAAQPDQTAAGREDQDQTGGAAAETPAVTGESGEPETPADETEAVGSTGGDEEDSAAKAGADEAEITNVDSTPDTSEETSEVSADQTGSTAQTEGESSATTGDTTVDAPTVEGPAEPTLSAESGATPTSEEAADL